MRILVVEDEKDLADAISDGLKKQVYSVDLAYNGTDAWLLVERNSYDLLILDLNLPGMDGLDICHRLRTSDVTTGILILTARARNEDRVLGLDLGADDYLVKPFHFPELLARVRAIMRRKGEPRKLTLEVGDLRLDTNAIEAYIGKQRLDLTVKEYAILEYLVRNIGTVVSQEELLEHVWNEDANLFTQVIKVHINHLRGKLKLLGNGDLIRTKKGLGYIIEGKA